MPRRVARTDAPTIAPEPVGDDVPLLTNGELSRIFHEIGDILEVKGEDRFKTVAYHRAADTIARASFEVAGAYRAAAATGTPPPPISGVGRAISDKIAELAATGRLGYHERLREEVPPSLVDLLQVSGIGPRTVRLVYEQLGVESIDDLRDAAQEGRIRTLKGLSERTEQQILAGIAALESRPKRLLINRAQAIADELTDAIRAIPGVRAVHVAGSLRRRRETIGDLDFLVETEREAEVGQRILAFGFVDEVLVNGRHKVAFRQHRGPQIDVMLMPPDEAGAYLVHFTGSAAHNTKLRGIARDRGWSLSEYGYVRLGENLEPLAGTAADRRTFSDEAGVYAFLDLPEIPPELREDHGEVEAARAGRLPTLILRTDIRGDLHTHSEWSDGIHTIEVMADACRRKGYEYQVLTDHTQSLAIANGLDAERVAEQREILRALNERFAAEEAAGELPKGANPAGFRLLHGCELEVRADGVLDYDDDLLASYDLVVASVHVSRRQPRAELTRRTLNAIRSPHVDVIAHPSGRMIQNRDDLDLDWETVYAEAARTGTALEMNGSPHRLDLAAERARRAVEVGCILTVDSDAHNTSELGYMRWGVEQARRAWVERGNVLNTRPRADLLAWVAGKPDRV